jgi:hypothetical protein
MSDQDQVNSNLRVQLVQKANQLKKNVKKLLNKIDTSHSKKGFVHNNAFFEIMELNGIRLRKKDQ